MPIYSTSVNRSGQPVLSSIHDIKNEFGGEVDLIVDGGASVSPGALPSTLVEILPESGIVLRVPFLFGSSAGMERCPLLKTTWNALHADSPWRMDDLAIRYPTDTRQVAKAILFLLERHAGGIYHYSGQDAMTRYTICRMMAKMIHRDMTWIRSSVERIPTEAVRPENSHLSCSRIFDEGFELPPSFEQSLREMLEDLKLLPEN